MGTPDRVPSSLVLGGPAYQPGWQEPVYLPNPAAGAGWSYQVSGRFSERLVAVTWKLVTDAVVANRFPTLALFDQDGVSIVSVSAGGTVVAGTTLGMSLTVGAPAFAGAATGVSRGYLPDLLVPPGWSWRSQGGGYDPGDQESAIVLLVQRFPSGLTRPDAPQ